MGSRTKFYAKRIICGGAFVLCLLCPVWVHGQTWNEIFRQKKTQEKYLLKQIAYLKLYADQAWKGYRLVGSGLKTISDFSSGEFRLHQAFISGLSKVSFLVGKDVRVEETAKYYILINASFGALQKSSASFSQADINYLRKVEHGLMAEVNGDMDELLDVVLSGELEMGDEERLSRLKRIHASMQQKEGFARWFCSELQGLSKHQKTEQFGIEELRRLYENN